MGPSSKIVIMILTSMASNLLRSLVMTRAGNALGICHVAFYVHRVKQVPYHILG